MTSGGPAETPVALAGIAEITSSELAELGDPIVANAVAVKRAAADARIPLDAIDALLTYDSLVAPHVMQATKVCEYLGLSPAYASTVGAGGASPLFAVVIGLGLIRSGAARNVAIAHADLRGSSGARRSILEKMAAVVGNPEFEDPFGPIVATMYGFVAQWLLEHSEATREDLAEIAVAARRWARLNANARMTAPLTVQDVLEAPPIAGPLGRLDCCLVTDFAGAAILCASPPDSARRILVAGVGGCVSHEEITQMPEDPLAVARATADRLYAESGLAPDDVEAAFLYDSFTVTVAAQILAYRLDRGHGLHELVHEVGIGPGGGLPINTHGGLLSASTSGIFHLIEATRQLRGEAGRRQVRGLRTVLVTGVGGILSHSCAALLQRASDA